MADHARRDQESMYCHACHHQWMRVGESIECPACMSASTEIVRRLPEHPQTSTQQLTTVKIDPENDPRHFHNRHLEQQTVSATETAAAASPAVSEPTGPTTDRVQDAGTATATPSQPPNNNTQNSSGAANPGSGDARNTASGQPRFTFHFAAPQVTFVTFVTNNTPPPATQAPPPPPPVTFYTMHLFPTAPPPTVNTTPAAEPNPHQNNTTTTNPQPTQPTNEAHQHQQPPPVGPFPAPPAGAVPFPPNFLAMLLAPFLNPAAAVHGDAVYTQEALDRILTQLREQAPMGGPPPASQAAIDRLRTKEVDDAMCGGEDKAKCVICVDEMVKGEKAAVLPCEHFFHGECVVPWLKLHGTCPVCRRSVEVPEGEKGVEGKVAGQTGAGFHQEGRPGVNEGLGDVMDCS